MLYLTASTWEGADGRDLAIEVRAMLQMRVKIHLIHEVDEARAGCSGTPMECPDQPSDSSS